MSNANSEKGDFVWWKHEDGKEYLAKVESKYAVVADLKVVFSEAPYLEVNERNPKLVKPENFRPANITDRTFNDAMKFAEQAKEAFVEALQCTNRSIDELHLDVLHASIMHAYLADFK